MALLALGFTACDDKSDLGVEQRNPQEAIMEADGLKVEYGEALAGQTLNIGNYANAAVWNTLINTPAEDTEAPLISVVEATNLPEGATVSFVMQMAKDASFSDPQEINLTDGKALGSQLGNAFQEIWGKTPVQQNAFVRFAAYVNEGTQVSRLGGLDRWYAQKEVTVIPVDILLPVADAYSVNLFAGGSQIESISMGHSEKHAYDDPMFTATFTVTPEQAAAGFAWDIAMSDGRMTYYPTADGKFVAAGEPAAITAPGAYRVEANMLDLSYTIGLAYELINTPGNANGWDAAAKEWALGTTDYNNYFGYVWAEGEFKFATGSWDVNWGTGAEEGTLALNGGNIAVPEAGLYYVTLNLEKLTYTMVKVESIGAIGDFNDWGGQNNLTIADNGRSIKGEVTFPADKFGWKFRVNDNWDINLGGSMTDLVPNGDNLTAPAAGTYEVTLNIVTHPYTCTMTAK